MIWTISESPIASSNLVLALASPSSHFFNAFSSSSVGLLTLIALGLESSLRYESNCRSLRTANMRLFQGIQLFDFNNSILYDPEVNDESSVIVCICLFD